ncbi:MAG: hypothetical protein NTX00_01570 [Candidatus Parcubacteria bacterium]|nr:hypothetical protein [Candidatus Parcubacteria bacterium]
MAKRSEWLKNYGIWVKIFLVLLFGVSLGGLNLINSCREISALTNLPNHDSKLGDWTRPSTYEGPEFEQWKARKEAAKKEIEVIWAEAKSKGESYSTYDYFKNYNQLMDLEDKYNFFLTTLNYPALSELVKIRDFKSNGRLNIKLTAEQIKFIDEVQTRIAIRHGEAPPHRDLCSGWQTLKDLLKWLWPKYLLLMFFWLLIYMIRFEEHKQSIRKFQRHHHELGRFIDVEEPFPGNLSFKEELLLCPERFLLRVILWPFYCLKYPLYETTAEMVRYNRLKAEYLRYQLIGYQLSDMEEEILRSKAKAPVKDFEKAIKGIKEFEITPLIVRKSLAAAYLSLFLGILLQPAIVLAAKHSEKINAHFYSQVQIVAMQNFDHQSIGPPDNDENQNPTWALPVYEPILSNFLTVLYLVLLKITLKFKGFAKKIEHIPISRLFLGAAKVFQPLTV